MPYFPVSSYISLSSIFERYYFVVRVGSQILHFSYFIQWFLSSTSVMIFFYFSVYALSLLFFLSYILCVASVVRSLQEDLPDYSHALMYDSLHTGAGYARIPH